MRKIYSFFLCLFFCISLFDGIEVKALEDNRTFYSPNDEIGTIKDIQVFGDSTFVIDENNVLWAWTNLYHNDRYQYGNYNLNIPNKLAENVKSFYIYGDSILNSAIFYLDLNNNLYRLTSSIFNESGVKNTRVQILENPILVSQNVKEVYKFVMNLYFINSNSQLYGIGHNFNSNSEFYGEDTYNAFGTFHDEYSTDPVFISSNVKEVYQSEFINFFKTLNNDIYQIKATGLLKVSTNAIKTYGMNGDSYTLKVDNNIYRKVFLNNYTESEESLFLEGVKELYTHLNTTFFAITNDDSLYVWGNPENSGTGSEEYIDLPVKILDNIKSFDSTYGRLFALSISGDLYAWGGLTRVLRDNEPDLRFPKVILDNVQKINIKVGDPNFILKNDNTLWYAGAYNFTFTDFNNVLHPVQIMSDVSNLIVSDLFSTRRYIVSTSGEIFVLNQEEHLNNSVIYTYKGYSTDGIKYKAFESSNGFGTAIYDDMQFSEYGTSTLYDNNGITSSIYIDINKINFDDNKFGVEIYRSEDGQNFKLIGVEYQNSVMYSGSTILHNFTFNDTNVEENKEYFYSYRLVENYVNDNQNVLRLRKYGSFSANKSITTSFFASNLRANLSNAGDITLEWDADENITGFEVYASTKYKDYEYLGETSNNWFKLSNKVDFSNYFYNFKIVPFKTINNLKVLGSELDYYESFSYYQMDLNIKTELINSSNLKISWDRTYSTTGYKLYKSFMFEDEQLIYSGNNTEFIDNLDTNSNKTVIYRLVANNNNQYMNTDEETFDFFFDSDSNKYLDLRVNGVSFTQNKLEWKYNRKKVHIYRSSNSDFSSPVYLGSTNDTYYLDNVRTDKEYYYLVNFDFDYEDNTSRNYSAIVASIPYYINENKISVNLTESTGNQTSLKWNPIEGYSNFELSFSKGISTTYTVLKNTTDYSFIHTGLTPNTDYNYRLRGYNINGSTKVFSDYSPVLKVKTGPAAPILKVVSKDANTLNLSWSSVPGATGYILVFFDEEIINFDSTTLSFENSEFETGETYKFSLIALNGDLRSARSAEVTGIPVPAAVGNLKFSEIRFNGFSLDWDEVAGADHYDVFQGTSSTAITTKVGSVTESQFTTTALLNFNTSYYYKVVPVTLSGLNGTASMILTGKTAISAPSGVSVSALSGSSTSVSYEAVNGAAGYEVHFSKGTSLTYTLLKAQTTVTPVVQTGLTANTVYNYKVRAYRMAGTTKVYSAFSEVKSITTPPSTPVLKVVSKDSSTLSLSWASVPGATQYELYQNSVLVDTLTSTVLTKDISGLELGSSYKYTLVALNGELRSASSVEVTGIPVPAAVGNLKFSEVRFNGFSLDWDEVAGADHYDVFQGTSSTAVTTKVGSVTESQFTTATLLNFNTTYYYKVVPVTLSGLNGTSSMILTGKTAISAPSGVSVSALSGSSTSVSYEAVNGAAGYEVHFSKGTSLTYTLLKAQTTVTPVVQTGLTANTVYNYKVRAYRMAGTTKVYSAFSDVKTITTPPSTPVLKVNSKNSDTLSLSWAAVPGATQYELYQNSVLIDTFVASVLSKDISGLDLGSSYKYSLVALNGELRSASSVEVTGIPVPAAVGNLKFSEVRFNGFSLDWDEVTGADHYDVFQGTTSTAVTTKVGSVTDSQFTTTALLNFNTSYYYKVVPVTLSGLNGTASMILTGKTAISAPSGVSVSALSGSSTSVSYEAVNGAAGYEVHFSKGTSLTYTLLKAQTTVTPVVQTGLTANTVYNYKVRAYRMAGTTKVYSAFSEVKSITTPPSTPVLKVVSKDSSTLSLSWASVPGATQYELYQNSVLVDTLTSTVLTKDISGLELGSSYKYTLVALNGELRSASSVEVTGIPVPAAVGNLKFSEVRFNGFSLDWDEVVGADHYDVFQGTTSTAITTKVGSVTESQFTTTTLLNFNTTYYYKVVPVTLSGLNGTSSMILTGKTAISAPSGVSVSALSGSSTSVSYEAVNGAAGYEVHFSKGTSLTYTLLKAQTTVTPVVQTGLTANTVYNYKVRAYRMAGTTKVYGSFSEVKSITTPPSTPVLKVVSKDSSTLTVSWAAVPGATSYEIYKDSVLLDTVSSSVLSLNVNSLNVGQSYGFYCVALNGELRSSNSTVVNGVPLPGAVSNFKVVDTQYNGFTLDWDGVAGADHYDVFQGTTSTTVTTKLASVKESEYKTTASLNFNASYYYKVVPVTSGGLNGTASSVLTAKTALAKPLNVSGNYLTNTSIELKWDAVNGAAGYEISYSKGTSTTYTVLRSVTTLSTTHTGLTENTAYNYRVRAYRMSGTVKLYSAYSDLVTPVLTTYDAINLLEYNDITSLDIHVAVDNSSWSTLINTMEGLVSLSKVAGEVESGVASSWSFDEPTLTWTFNLNPNAVWVNNQGVVQRSVTASDFVYAWNRLAADTTYQYNYYLEYILFIESYQAVNATTLKVKVTEYQPFFLNSLVKPNMFPMAPENLSTFGTEYGNSNNSVWYNGAYYLSSWNRDVNAKWTKNNKYWNAGIVKTPEVNIKFDSTGDLNDELTEFDTGLIDLMTLSGDNYASRKNDSSLILFPESAIYYLFINTANSGMYNGSPVIDETAGNPLFDNRKIRQAIAYYLDKEKVTNAIGSYPYKVANYFVPSNFVSYNGNAYESSRGSGYMLKNQDLARSLFVEGMTELGYIEGDNLLTVDYVIFDSTTSHTIADTIISDLNVLFSGYGITINKRTVPFGEFLGVIDEGDYDMAYMGWGPDYRWPTTYLDNYLSYSAYNNVGYNNSTYDDLLYPYGKTKSQIWTDLQLAEKVLLEDANIIPIIQRLSPKLVNSRLKGVSMNYSDIGLYYKWIYKE